MPDWSYQTLFKPLLFRLPPEKARDLTLGAMGALSRLPFGTLTIRTLGHMELSPILDETRWGVRLRYPVGLSGGLDVHGTARKALSQFGFGFMEIGPITIEPIRSAGGIQRIAEEEAIVYPSLLVNDGVDKIVEQLERERAESKSELMSESKSESKSKAKAKATTGRDMPLFLRLRHMPGAAPEQALEQILSMLGKVAPYAAGFYIDATETAWSEEELLVYVEQAAQLLKERDESKPLFLYIQLDESQDRLIQLLAVVEELELAGVVLGDANRISGEGEGYLVGKASLAWTLELIRFIRGRLSHDKSITASGGIHEPEDALEARRCGADYVQLHSGLVYAGPGLPKRINEGMIHEKLQHKEQEQQKKEQQKEQRNAGIKKSSASLQRPTSFWQGWGWMWLLGLGMIIGGVIAWIIAATTVLLPYDESYLGMDGEGLHHHNERILPFMSHDRITLAGTMLSIGILYVQLTYYGLRLGQHWAKTALLASATVGFCSFFLYLGYGYFDPLHAAAAAILLPMFVLGMRGKADAPLPFQPNRRNDRLWRRALWGQLMFVSLGAALAVGGLTIAGVGITHVFVPQDLTFMSTAPEILNEANERLLPLIAHDRAGFGGALLSDAIAILAASLWGIQQGQRWLWWTLLIGGLPGFVAGFGVHAAIGYLDFIHLLPAFVAVGLYIVGLVLLYPYMHAKSNQPA
ncbi:hypothetical protein [Paenibacillus koleovorans]|uniref:hypothetical protein n=1 Tax=Paenibacillus koleovorans TaxID=121608 RepID=UPI000FDC13F8|nr:hypothetical protein [Paenibacillus koleovorans]